ncbi:glycerophosphocholine phosphodiesterase GPCPD1-like [Mercenaria mercenaria]|uniref:glycerophosphocholine phosphodiesterase GPCPD1-like n=1 Tax=Mercenaria mercenaria TaxID=6596 RepID=UPI00234F0586|nr:glycerophosphocholine phosphodiesterase GPCPD1-like [Mercenaria mercenaria]
MQKETTMLTSVTYDVLFNVRADTCAGEVVCVTGDCDELGNWDPDQAVKLRRQADKNVWSKQMTFTCQRESMKYRYFIAQLFQSEDHEEKSTIVTLWETNISPRVISLHNFGKEGSTNNVATFGEYGNLHHVTRGWLIDQSQINIRFHGNPIKMWNTKYRNQTYSIKCTPIDHRYRDEHSDEEGEHLPHAANTSVRVSVLEKGRSVPQVQSEYGAIYTPDCYMSFMVQTLELETTGFQLDFYVHERAGEDDAKDSLPRHVGYAFILPLDIYRSVDTKTVPITSLHHKPLGQIKFEYLVVKAMIGRKFGMEVSYQKYWKHSREPLDIGHRGMGISYAGSNMLATVPENTVKSLMDAANNGADFVEFDVHLTKDKEVIVYHDFKVNITYKKKQNGGIELLQVPVKDLKLAELQHMKVCLHVYYVRVSFQQNGNSLHKPRPENIEEINSDEDTHEDLETFPTLERCLNSVDKHTGFNIELKFPQELKTGTHEQEGYHDMNVFLDTVLRVVFEHHGGRRIVFSSFDSDTCIALRLKQNRYPVLFLTQADTTIYEPYGDIRTTSVPMAAEFCIAHDLLGVNPMSDILLNDLSLIDYVKDSGLVLFTWGEGNNNSDVINKLKKHRVDAIIYDRIDHFKTDKESIFKLEHKKKLEMLHGQFLSIIDVNSSGTAVSS